MSSFDESSLNSGRPVKKKGPSRKELMQKRKQEVENMSRDNLIMMS
jgi:hypothetical protein